MNFRYFVVGVVVGLSGCATGATGGGQDHCGNGTVEKDLGEQCDDGNTIDGDGCSSDCHNEATSETICNDAVDNDNDGKVDCGDDDCDGLLCGENGRLCREHMCVCPGGDGPESNCTDGSDDDCDGQVDCADSDCATDPVCNGDAEGICGDGVDNDTDGQTDCADSDCDGKACGENGRVCRDGSCVCPGGQETETNCSNAQDDDCDGQMDCLDSDCDQSPDCVGQETNCGDGVDNDGDGTTDCADSDCSGRACAANGKECVSGACQCPGGQTTETNCTDNNDDDCDGLIDCSDGDCSANPACVNAETNCSDGVDNDGDGHTDCADSDCVNSPCGSNGRRCQSGVCQCPGGQTSETACADFVDDDCDGTTDCADSDCSMSPSCRETNCSDNVDNDGDGHADCADSDCASMACGPHGLTCQSGSCQCPGGSTELACSDSQDNDCDGDVDCADSDCASSSACVESVCTDGVDNDHDGQTDCADSDCAGLDCGPHGLKCQSGTCQCPGGSTETACSDLQDNDCDGAMDCSDSDCSTDPACSGATTCTPDALLLCGLEGDGSTVGQTNDVQDYSCTTLTESGPEYVYQFLTTTNVTATVDLTNMSSDLDLFAIDDQAGECDPSNCLTDSVGVGDESIVLNPAGAHIYYLSVDGFAGNSGTYHIAATCSGGSGCSASFLVNCGDSDSYQTGLATSTDNVSSYSCASLTEDGPEYTYLFAPSSGSSATVTMSPSGADLDLFVLDWSGGTCAGTNCNTYSAGIGSETVTFSITPGNLYFVVVDGWNGAQGSYTINFTCN